MFSDPWLVQGKHSLLECDRLAEVVGTGCRVPLRGPRTIRGEIEPCPRLGWSRSAGFGPLVCCRMKPPANAHEADE